MEVQPQPKKSRRQWLAHIANTATTCGISSFIAFLVGKHSQIAAAEQQKTIPLKWSTFKYHAHGSYVVRLQNTATIDQAIFGISFRFEREFIAPRPEEAGGIGAIENLEIVLTGADHSARDGQFFRLTPTADVKAGAMLNIEIFAVAPEKKGNQMIGPLTIWIGNPPSLQFLTIPNFPILFVELKPKSEPGP